MGGAYDILDFYPKTWRENDKARVTIWWVLGLMLIIIAWLSWSSLYYFPQKMDSQGIILDSLQSHVRVLAHNDSIRSVIDAERREAMVEWRKSFERDEARKRVWDQRFKRDTIGGE